MALGSLNLRVSKEDFEARVSIVEDRMAMLMDVIERYNKAKQNLDQFMGSEDSNVEAVLQRIDTNIMAAKKAYSALNETKLSLQETVNQMESMSNEVKQTIDAATEAATSTIDAAITINSIL